MSRSNLTTKYHLGVIDRFEKEFKSNYKKDNDEKFKGNVLMYTTLGVIQRKEIPDISDCITLIKLGNNNCDDQQAYDLLERWLDIDENKDRGIVGAFCELCKDLCLDINVNKTFKEQINKLEETVTNRQDSKKKLLESLTNMTEMLNKLKNKQDSEKEISENKDEELSIEETIPEK